MAASRSPWLRPSAAAACTSRSSPGSQPILCGRKKPERVAPTAGSCPGPAREEGPVAAVGGSSRVAPRLCCAPCRGREPRLLPLHNFKPHPSAKPWPRPLTLSSGGLCQPVPAGGRGGGRGGDRGGRGRRERGKSRAGCAALASPGSRARGLWLGADPRYLWPFYKSQVSGALPGSAAESPGASGTGRTPVGTELPGQWVWEPNLRL